MAAEDSGVTRLLEMIPPVRSAPCLVVEAAHFTLRPKNLENCRAVEGDGIFYLKAPVATAILPFEVHRVPLKKAPDQCWIVLALGKGERLELPEALAGGEVRAIAPASARYLALLDEAIELFRRLKANATRAVFCLLIGDLRLPEELRRPTMWALTQSCRQALGRIESASIVLLAETSCQNKGKRVVLESARQSRGDPAYADFLYEKLGYAVLQSELDNNSGYWLCADALLEPDAAGHPVIALTKYSRTRPSCAVTLAGKMVLLAEIGATHHVALYDADDDALIRQKSVEGLAVAAFFAPKSPVDSVSVVQEGRKHFAVDHVDPHALARPGRLASRSALIAKTAHRIQELGVARFRDSIPDVCCEIPRF